MDSQSNGGWTSASTPTFLAKNVESNFHASQASNSLHACDTGHKGPYARCQELIKVQRYVTWKVVAL